MMQPATKTFGISPKVYVPAAAQLAVGGALYAIGSRDTGKAVLAGGAGTLVLGYLAGAGEVIVDSPSYIDADESVPGEESHSDPAEALLGSTAAEL